MGKELDSRSGPVPSRNLRILTGKQFLLLSLKLIQVETNSRYGAGKSGDEWFVNTASMDVSLLSFFSFCHIINYLHDNFIIGGELCLNAMKAS